MLNKVIFNYFLMVRRFVEGLMAESTFRNMLAPNKKKLKHSIKLFLNVTLKPCRKKKTKKHNEKFK